MSYQPAVVAVKLPVVLVAAARLLRITELLTFRATPSSKDSWKFQVPAGR